MPCVCVLRVCMACRAVDVCFVMMRWTFFLTNGQQANGMGHFVLFDFIFFPLSLVAFFFWFIFRSFLFFECSIFLIFARHISLASLSIFALFSFRSNSTLSTTEMKLQPLPVY